MGKIKLFPTTEYSSKQPSDPVVPLVPCTGIFLGPSKSGKTVALISLILEQYRGVFERIYVFSPSVNIDDGWIPVKKYIEGDLGVNTEREQTYWDEWDEAALRRIIQQQRKITEASKKLEMKKLYQVLVVIDDFADTPQLHKPHGALDTLFIRGRHMQISTWVSSQKLRLISAAVRVNMQFLCCWRLRNQHELDAVIEELSALLPKEQLYRLYEQATREPYSFLFVYYLKPRNEMFYKRFEEPSKERDTGNAGIPCRNPALNSPPGRIESIWETPSKERDSTQVAPVPRHFKTSATCATCVHIPVAPAADVSHVITNYEAVAGYFGHWLHRAQCPTLLTGEIGQIKLSHIRKKKPGAGLVRAPRPKPRSRPRFAEPSNGRSSD